MGLFDHRNVPIVGEVKIKAWTGPQVVIECTCEDKPILAISGFGIAIQCVKCKQVWTIAEFNHNGATNQGSITVVPVEAPK